MSDLQTQFGQIDIYLFDQLLRGRITPGMRVFDAGCGYGRNLVYFVREKYEVFGSDADHKAIDHVRRMAGSPDNFRVENLEAMSFPAHLADVVISSAVLHFARDEHQFDAMLDGSWRILKAGGLFFCRLASTIGIEQDVQPIGGRRYRLPDGSDRFLVDAAFLDRHTSRLRGQMLDPIKTTVVHNQRSMTTWVLRKLS
jgi:SAM-dependent methyltransferase